LWDFGPQTYPEEQFGDHITASWAVDQLSRPQDRPFFLAVGFYRPHVPLYAPVRFFDARPVDAVRLPAVQLGDRDDLPPAAIELTANATPPRHDWFVSARQWRPAVNAYLAATSFTDAQVGRLLDGLDHSPYRDNTIIVLFSDHGFHLGEKQRWAKQSLWERSTRVPMIISVPEGLRGERCRRPVELLSLFPTLAELCRLPIPEGLDGISLKPLLEDPRSDWRRAAVTTYQRDNHAVRDEHYRYIRYADGSEELYDHRVDPNEWRNLAAQPGQAAVKAALSEWLPTVNDGR
jgi:arylsulfatase A-like enzyme